MSDCSDLIGLRYRLGADGTGGEIDCIHLVLTALDRMAIPRPAVNPEWYGERRFLICRDLLRWGKRIEQPQYDGDVILLRTERPTFAVAWQTGMLYINQTSEVVGWCPIKHLPSYHGFRCCHTSKT